jgi:competence protein ComEA
MFGSARPDGSAARARLSSLSPRWTPTGAAIDAVVQRGAAQAPAQERMSGARASDPEAARHALPEAPRRRWRLDGAAARGLVSLSLAAVAGALVVVLIGWPRGTSVELADGATAVDSPETGSVLSDPSSTAATVVVDVDGKVRRPGVVELADGSRVIDAIKKAGGLALRGDTGALNLAEVLIDGQQIVVPAIGQASTAGGGVIPEASPGVATPAPGSGIATSVSINSAAEAELETLPGIGPVLAAAIVEWRTQNGGFTSVEQLQEVSGIGPATFADIAPLVRL